MKLSVIIPVYNETNTIEEIINRVQAVNLNKEIIIVDDNSSDGTKEKLKRLNTRHNLKLIFQKKNKGKGAALRAGFKIASGDFVIIQDADLEYDPKDYQKLLEPLLDGRADVVYGSRFSGGPQRVFLFWHYVGNKFLTLVSNILNNLNLSDMETCYKAFRADILKELKFESNRFGFEPEFTTKVAKKGYKIYEVSISYSGRGYGEGKKITWKDGVKAFFVLLKYQFSE